MKYEILFALLISIVKSQRQVDASWLLRNSSTVLDTPKIATQFIPNRAPHSRRQVPSGYGAPPPLQTTVPIDHQIDSLAVIDDSSQEFLSNTPTTTCTPRSYADIDLEDEPTGSDGELLRSDIGYVDLSCMRRAPVLDAQQCITFAMQAMFDAYWQYFKRRENKIYTENCEEATAYATFLENVKELDELNVKAKDAIVESGQPRPIMHAINSFADTAPYDWAQTNLIGIKYKARNPDRNTNAGVSSNTSESNIAQPGIDNYAASPYTPEVIVQASGYRAKRQAGGKDWRKEGALTPVKNQKQCGSCWAFTATAAIEALDKITNGKLTSLSEQQLIDCSDEDGCEGSWYGSAFEQIIDNDGTADDCQTKDSVTKISDFQDIPKENEAAMIAAVDKQPVATAMHMLDDLRSYAGGVYARDGCPDKLKYLNHSVLIVGYGKDDNGKYWIVRNSWGTGWGDGGYMLVKRGVNMCGIEHSAAIPII